MKTRILLFFIGVSVYAVAQNAVSPKQPALSRGDSQLAENTNATQVQIPVYDLDFKPKAPVPGFTAPAAISMPIHCSPDGATFLNSLVPPDFSSNIITSISGADIVSFSLKNISDLQDVRFLDYFPSDKSLDLLVYAAPTKSDEDSLSVTNGPPARKDSTKYHQYIARFDRKGNYKKSIELPSATHVYHFAALSSGNILLSGFDVPNNVPRLLLIGSDGEELRPLELPTDFRKTKELDQLEQSSSRPPSVAASQIFSQGTFTAQDQGIVYWHPGSATVLSIIGDTTLREVKMEIPKGYSLDSFIPADSKWVVSFRRSNLPKDSAVDNKPSLRNFVIYQVNAQDGSLIRELHPQDDNPAWIACAREGKLTAFKTDKQSDFIPLTADIPK